MTWFANNSETSGKIQSISPSLYRTCAADRFWVVHGRWMDGGPRETLARPIIDTVIKSVHDSSSLLYPRSTVPWLSGGCSPTPEASERREMWAGATASWRKIRYCCIYRNLISSDSPLVFLGRFLLCSICSCRGGCTGRRIGHDETPARSQQHPALGKFTHFRIIWIGGEGIRNDSNVSFHNIHNRIEEG